MKPDKSSLLHTIYKYYPLDIQISPEYDLSSETQMKWRTINDRKEKNFLQFRRLYVALKTHVNDSILDESACYDKEFCNYLRYTSRIGDFYFRFHILFSFLEPLYCILTACYNQQYTECMFTCDYEDIKKQEVIPENVRGAVLSEAELIKKEIHKFFDITRVKFSELQDIVPRIETHEKKEGEVNLFDCVFTGNLQLF